MHATPSPIWNLEGKLQGSCKSVYRAQLFNPFLPRSSNNKNHPRPSTWLPQPHLDQPQDGAPRLGSLLAVCHRTRDARGRDVSALSSRLRLCLFRGIMWFLSETRNVSSTCILLPSTASHLPEACSATAHNLALADQLGAEFGTIQSQVNIKVDTVEGALRGIHALEVLLQVLA